MSYDYALDTILDTFESVINTLEYVKNSKSSNNNLAVHMAGCLTDYLLSKQFVLTVLCFKIVFEILIPVNTLLQSSNLDLQAEIQVITEAQVSITKLGQNKDIFHCQIYQVKSLIKESDELEFEELKILCARKKKRMMD